MASKNIELKVGILVLISVAILILAVYLARGYRYGQDFYSISVMFPEVGALSAGDPVAVSGVTKGKVQKLSLHEGGVLVKMDLAKDVILKEDASFIVKNIGLMGERFVAVKTGKSSVKLDLNYPATGSFDAGIPEVMGTMGQVVEKMRDLISSLEKTAISPATLDKFSETVANLNQLAARLNAATERNTPHVDSAISDFTELAHNLKVGLNRNQPKLDTAMTNLDSTSRRLVAALSDLEQASAKFKSFAEDLNQSEGTLHMLMQDRRLYDDLRKTAKNLDSLVADIRRNPKKYINFSVEIF